jgi:hypothetical protein
MTPSRSHFTRTRIVNTPRQLLLDLLIPSLRLTGTY